MDPLGSTKSKIKKDENGENGLYLEVTEVVLTLCNVINISYQQVYILFIIHFFLINRLVNH